MVLAHYAIHASEAEIRMHAQTTLEYGTAPEHLASAAERYGLVGEWERNATIEGLRGALENRIPVIVNWFSTDEGHYSVVVGVDETSVTLLDPEIGAHRTFDHETFMRAWFDFPFPWIQTSSDLRIRWMLPLTKRTTEE